LQRFPILDMLPHSGDIHDQSLKWYKIDGNLACFGPQIFFGGEPPPQNFWNSVLLSPSNIISYWCNWSDGGDALFEQRRPKVLLDSYYLTTNQQRID